ncbi:tRNA guanosine(34) transglycosylase Tgt [Candidatus Woesearchaeota archaeon]|nr:tRNA guanosine(34) transglycosylase Tgt [Candidatus Woesearchaeota archaeon]
MPFSFKITRQDRRTKARLGIITTSHGSFQTPAFIPVATAASVRALDFQDLKNLGAEAVLANTYHLHLRPGEKIIKKFGGLHKFMGWDGPIVTDSGGFQVFSLGFGVEHNIGKMGWFPNEGERAGKDSDFPQNKNNQKPEISSEEKFAHIGHEGVSFIDPMTGKKVLLTPLLSMQIQSDLGADIIFAFDECTSPLHDESYTKDSLERTHRWAKGSLKHYNKKQALFGIVQGGLFKNLREESARFIGSLPFAGFGIGGPLGGSKKDMENILDWTIPLLPADKPAHMLGIGAVEDLFNCVEKGADMFDCAAPTKWARRGHVYISPKERGNKKNKFRINIDNAEFREDKNPIDRSCSCFTCKNHSRAYLHHLFRAKEISFFRLASMHNLQFILKLVEKIREGIKQGKFQSIKEYWIGD